MSRIVVFVAVLVVASFTGVAAAQEDLITAKLSYQAPGNGPAPNFSPKGTQVPLRDVDAKAVLPPGAVRPARIGSMKIGPNEQSWVPVLATSSAEHPKDLCRLYVDRNRNGNFADDGSAVEATPSVREKTGDVWTSFNRITLDVPYPGGAQPYLVNFWIVRQGDAVPDVLRYSVGSWRSGTAAVRGTDVLVAAMDGDNDALFTADDYWSVLEASATDAPKRVLSIAEARATTRLMFVQAGSRDLVLEFRSFSADGRAVTFAVVDRPVTKAQDRAGDDALAPERSRPRATTPFAWQTGFDSALAKAAGSGRRLIVDFWTTWCGPCRMMDEWIWTDAEVAGVLNAGYVGVKLDGDVEKALVARYGVKGYPTVIVLGPDGKEIVRVDGYRSSKEVLEIVNKK